MCNLFSFKASHFDILHNIFIGEKIIFGIVLVWAILGGAQNLFLIMDSGSTPGWVGSETHKDIVYHGGPPRDKLFKQQIMCV